MTHVLIAADLFTLGFLFIALIVVVILVVATSSGQLRPHRRRRDWHDDDSDYPTFGLTGLGHPLEDDNNGTFSDSQNPLSIYQGDDNVSHSTELGGAGSVLGLNSETHSSSVNDSGGFGGLGGAAGEFLNLDDSGGGGTFGDGGGYSSDSSFSDSGNSFSDNSGGGSTSSDN